MSLPGARVSSQSFFTFCGTAVDPKTAHISCERVVSESSGPPIACRRPLLSTRNPRSFPWPAAGPEAVTCGSSACCTSSAWPTSSIRSFAPSTSASAPPATNTAWSTVLPCSSPGRSQTDHFIGRLAFSLLGSLSGAYGMPIVGPWLG